ERDIRSGQEQHMLLEEFKPAPSVVPAQTFVELFEQQEKLAPNAFAVEFGEWRLTYAELNAGANQLAHYLIGLGVGPGTLVAIALERSLEMVVTMLGIVKAGAAYLPLDPEYPDSRVAYMLGDAEPQLVISRSRLLDRLPQMVYAVNLDNPEVQSALDQSPAHNPTDRERISPLLDLHPAYIIYTSGSTGQPK